MTYRTRAAAMAVMALVLLGALPTAAQPNQSQAGQWTMPRTADGQPDLQGIWANNVATPLERPVAFEGKDALTDEELAELEQRILAGHRAEERSSVPSR